MNTQIGNWKIYALGDHAIVFALEDKVDPMVINKIMSLHHFILSKKRNGIVDSIPSYHTLTIVYDVNIFFTSTTNTEAQLMSFANQMIHETNAIPKSFENKNAALIKIPVCYESEFAIDIQNMSTQKNISANEIIQLHTDKIYEVYSIGFLPGFAYMGIVDERIQMLRHEKPRAQVLAGSVGIAGVQTGIYPSNSPGGWQIIGRTPLQIFDPNPNILAKFNVGDQIQFYAISKTEFEKINEHNN